MNSDNIAISYANDDNLLYSTHYATLVSPLVSYEQPVGEFILSYITPHMSRSDREEKTNSNKEKNILNKDNLGADPITCSNTIKLRVPRYMFYIKNSVIIGNKTPCSCNLAMGISDGVLGAAQNAAQQISDQIVDAVSGKKNGFFQTALSIANQILPSFINMPDTAGILAILNAIQSTNAAATTAGNAQTAEQGVAKAVVNGTDTVVNAQSNTKPQSSTTKSSNKTTSDQNTENDTPQEEQQPSIDEKAAKVIKAAQILRKVGSIASIASNASKIGDASSLAGIIQIIQAAIQVAEEIEEIIEILGVPGQPTVEAAKTAAGANATSKALKDSKEAAAQASGHSFGEIMKMISEDIKKVADMASKVGKMASQIGNMVGVNTDFIDQAVNTVNQAQKIASAATNLAQMISKDNASLVDILSAAGATSAEIAGALGANTVSNLALSAGMTAAQTVKAINDTVNKTTTRAETAEAAKKAAIGSAGSTAFELTAMMISTAIDVAQQCGLLSSKTAMEIGATMDMITMAEEVISSQIDRENQTKETTEQAAEEADKEEKPLEDKIMFVIDKASRFMQAIGGSSTDVGKAAVQAADFFVKELGLSDDERLSRVFNFAKEALSLNGSVSVQNVSKVVTLGVSTIAGLLNADKAKKDGKPADEQMQAGAKGAADYITDKEGIVPPEEASEHVGTVAQDVGSSIPDHSVEKVTEQAGEIAKKDYLTRAPLPPGSGVIGGGTASSQTGTVVDPRNAKAEEIKKKVAAMSAAKYQHNAQEINNELNKNAPTLKQTAYDEAAAQAETSTNNTAFCGIGTSSPVVVNIRKEYFKGTKFIIANAGGRVDMPYIISVIDDDSIF